MNIKLVDVDSTIPNLALMKLSAWHKAQGHKVSIERLGIPFYPNERRDMTITTNGYDKVYLAAIFSGTIDSVKLDMWSDESICIYGGTGIDIEKTLPKDVESMQPDYSIYPENDTAYGFISRGCNRKCYFCVVPQKEGRVHQVETDLKRMISDFKKLKLLDNNILQLPNHAEVLTEIAEIGIRCDLNNGLDIRMITEENSELLSRLNHVSQFIFAFDDYKYRRFIERKIELLGWMKPWQAKFYCYVNPDMELFETVKRIEWLRERKMLPYVMRDIACFGSDKEQFYTDLAAYANQPAFVKKMDFVTFLNKRHTDQIRIDRNTGFYEDAMSVPDRKFFEIKAAA